MLPKSPPVTLHSRPDDQRNGIVLELAQLFVLPAEHRRDDLHVFEELMGELYPAAGSEERRATAAILADRADLPARVAAMIAADEAEIAGPVLERCRSLATIDRIRLVGNGSEAHRMRLALRRDLEEAVIAALLIHGGPATIEALSANPDLTLTPQQMDRLLDRVLEVGAGLQMLTERQDIGPTRLIDIFFELDRPARRRALLGFDVETAFRRIEKRGRRTPPSKPEGLEAQLLDAAISRQPDVFAGLLIECLRLPADLAVRIVRDPGGEPLVIALSAIGLDAADATSILVRSDPAFGWTYDMIRDLARLYDAIGWRTAEAVLERWMSRASTRGRGGLRQTDAAEGVRREAMRIDLGRSGEVRQADPDRRSQG